jgi:3-hydroxyacyl-[acyl-carrier-protein] dehydratase
MIKAAFLNGDIPLDQRNTSNVRYRAALCVPPEHPCLPGHFPGDPLVPGVVLLEHVARALRDWRNLRLARVLEVKFLAPLHPGEQAQLELDETDGRIRFAIQRERRVLARGVIEGAV